MHKVELFLVLMNSVGQISKKGMESRSMAANARRDLELEGQ